ncbi:hypothetical protein F5J12DRAFT_856388 [Pisolithus orientalis]|uniref:uncharacterized protein n=1 Tax=Pisolithus orientalis TaxID=936130 RepID=UPI00222554FE|nr:uncharacterized protein F5J12DRAFT_856388 [Pisolithus orientalis]KAI5994885.1 hypothetical protein F5J12DRAFT_856388 [Pisolithus orientalis]
MVDCERCERGSPAHIRNSRSHNICEDCDKDYDYLHESDLIQHYRTENGYAYCHWCDTVLKGQRGLDDHNKSCHYCCRECGRRFRTENGHRHHLRSKAHRKADIPCRCGRSFISSAAWILHFERGVCPIMPNIDRYLVKQHVREIERCGRGRRLLVTDHDHEDRVYRCPDPSCTRRFDAFGALFQHIESESCNARKDQALNLLATVDRRIHGA